MNKQFLYVLGGLATGVSIHLWIGILPLSIICCVFMIVVFNYFDRSKRFYRLAANAVLYISFSQGMSIIFKDDEKYLNLSFSDQGNSFYLGMAIIIVISLLLDFLENKGVGNLQIGPKAVFKNNGDAYSSDRDININKS